MVQILKCFFVIYVFRFIKNSYNFSWFHLYWSNKNTVFLLSAPGHSSEALHLACFCLLSLFMESLSFRF